MIDKSKSLSFVHYVAKFVEPIDLSTSGRTDQALDGFTTQVPGDACIGLGCPLRNDAPQIMTTHGLNGEVAIPVNLETRTQTYK